MPLLASSLLAVLVLVVMLVVGAGSALAARGHVFEKAFGSEGSGESQFKRPDGVAVNEATGQVYVVDEGANRVARFDGEGHFLSEFNGSGLLPGEEKAADSGEGRRLR
jgi:DNA-binding beta-propeller fold protein YncE